MPERDGKLHIYLTEHHIPTGTLVQHGYTNVYFAMHRLNYPEIHTTNLAVFNSDTIFVDGYTIIVHTSHHEYFTLIRKGNRIVVTYSDPEKVYRKELRYAHNLLKLLLSGTFCDMNKYDEEEI